VAPGNSTRYAALSWLVTVPHLPDTLPRAGTHISHGRAPVAAAGGATCCSWLPTSAPPVLPLSHAEGRVVQRDPDP